MTLGHADQKFNIGLLFISFGTAFLGSYLAICLLEQLRAIYLHQGSNNLLNRLKWYLLIGLALGGIGIWSMHFVGMAALRLRDEDSGQPVPIRFNIAVSVLSIVVVVFTTSLGALVSSHDRLFAKSKAEILEMFIAESSVLTIGQIKKMKNWIIIRIMCTKDLTYLVIGGVIAGTGVSVMHYIGMAAMEFPGYIKWDAGIIAASILIAIFAATAAFWILFRVLSIFPNYESFRMTSAAIMMIAVCGMHYTGMMAATMMSTHQQTPQTLSSVSVDQADVIIPLIVIEMIVCWIIAIVLFSDLRHIVHKYRYQLKKHNMFTPGKMSNHSVSSNSSGEEDARAENKLFASLSSKLLFSKSMSVTGAQDLASGTLSQQGKLKPTSSTGTASRLYQDFGSFSSSISRKILPGATTPLHSINTVPVTSVSIGNNQSFLGLSGATSHATMTIPEQDQVMDEVVAEPAVVAIQPLQSEAFEEPEHVIEHVVEHVVEDDEEMAVTQQPQQQQPMMTVECLV